MEFTSEEIICLEHLDNNLQTFEDLALKSNLNIDSIRRAIGVLQQKNLVDLKKDEFISYKLSKFGQLYLKDKFPEEVISEILKKETSLEDFRKALKEKSGFIIGYGLKNKLFKVENNLVILEKQIDINYYKDLKLALESFVSNSYSDNDLNLLKKENLLEEVKKNVFYVKKNESANDLKDINTNKTENYLTQDILKSGNIDIKFKPYNVVADVESLSIGKYQPYMRFLNLIKNKLVGMGFEEMHTNYITTEFYNFDVLFQPQNHSARTWTDTYSLKNPNKLELKELDLIKKIKDVHEKGNKESKGWRYSWDLEVAQKLMPSAHGTAWSAKQMSLGINENKKYFAIARVFRPDVLDATHLNEFNQLEGFVTGDNISFKNLLGLLKEFAKEVAGADEVFFMPGYYPFTEPSVSLFARHKDLGLIELGGAGIFRPEITETLGIKGRVIAWGLGIDRLAMFRLGINDIRDLFTNKLDWLRDKPILKDI